MKTTQQTAAFFTKLTALKRPDGSQINLCKTLNADGTVKQYDMAANYTAEHVNINSIEELEQLLISISKDRSSCIVQGLFTGDEDKITARNGQTMIDYHNSLMVFDFDSTGIQVDYTNNDSVVDGIIKLVDSMPVEISRASSVFKLSSTAGFNGKTELKGHLYVINKTAYRRAELKAWAAEKGIGCDLGVIHPVQIVYTSDPIFQTGHDHIKSRIFPVIGDGEANVVIDTNTIKVREVSGDLVLADPTKKSGIIGAFCRAFTIEDCIDRHLSDVFKESDARANHYDYLKGSGSVEGCFLSSCGHYLVNTHASDPMKGRSANSWDLVQMHKFAGDFEKTRAYAESFTEVMVELKGAAARYGSSKKSIDAQIEESNREISEANKRKEMNAKIWGSVDYAVSDKEPTQPCVAPVPHPVLAPVVVSHPTEELSYFGIPESRINWETLTAREQLALMGDPHDAHLVPILQARLMSDTKLSYLHTNVVSKEDRDAARALIDANLDTSRGSPTKGLANATLILSVDPYLKDLYAYNEFANMTTFTCDTPWSEVNKLAASIANCPIDSNDDVGVILYIHKTYGIEFSVETIRMAVNAYAYFHRRINPMKDYLRSLKWDGKKRIDTALIRHAGVEDNKYTRAVTRKFFAAAVARALDPGCKWDYLLVMLGDQGLSKSMFASALCPWPNLFAENPPAVGTKELITFIQGKWIIELSECASLTGKESEKTKAFISGRVDRFRVPYQARDKDHPRSFVVIASANPQDILTSEHGNRRFWPVVVTKQITMHDVEVERDQLWAEAVEAYNAGENLWLEDSETNAMATDMQRDHMADGGITGMVKAWLDKPTPKWWLDTPFENLQQAKLDEDWNRPEACVKRMAVSLQEIYVEVLGNKPGPIDTLGKKDIRMAIAQIGGWSLTAKEKLSRGKYGESRCYTRNGFNKAIHAGSV